jgi:hypothetical protein
MFGFELLKNTIYFSLNFALVEIVYLKRFVGKQGPNHAQSNFGFAERKHVQFAAHFFKLFSGFVRSGLVGEANEANFMKFAQVSQLMVCAEFVAFFQRPRNSA